MRVRKDTKVRVYKKYMIVDSRVGLRTKRRTRSRMVDMLQVRFIGVQVRKS